MIVDISNFWCSCFDCYVFPSQWVWSTKDLSLPLQVIHKFVLVVSHTSQISYVYVLFEFYTIIYYLLAYDLHVYQDYIISRLCLVYTLIWFCVFIKFVAYDDNYLYVEPGFILLDSLSVITWSFQTKESLRLKILKVRLTQDHLKNVLQLPTLKGRTDLILRNSMLCTCQTSSQCAPGQKMNMKNMMTIWSWNGRSTDLTKTTRCMW